MPLWTPIENPGTRPPRSRAFDIRHALLAAVASFGTFPFAQPAHPAHPSLAVSLVVAVLAAWEMHDSVGPSAHRHRRAFRWRPGRGHSPRGLALPAQPRD